MSQRITLIGRNPGRRISGGVVFTDGVAEVDSLGVNTRRFFEAKGATIEELGAGGKSLDDMSRAELADFAEREGLDVKNPGRVAEFRDAVKTAVADKAKSDAETEKDTASATFSDVLGLGQATSNTVTTSAGDEGNADASSVDNSANTAGE